MEVEVIYLLRGGEIDQKRDVSHLDTECLAGLPSTCLLNQSAVLWACAGDLQPSAVFGIRHSSTRQTHLSGKVTGNQNKTSAIFIVKQKYCLDMQC